MPLLSATRQLLELAICDKDFNGLLLKQKARFTSLTYSQAPTGECSAQIMVLISLYAPAGDDYGPQLPYAAFPPRPETLRADNQTLVEVATGRILAQRNGAQEADWQATIARFEQNTMLQADYLATLAEEEPVKLNDMIRRYIQQADAAGKFA